MRCLNGIMITSKEGLKINRPLLYLVGGLVLGETMALWMTVKQESFGLAVLLLVFSCAFLHRANGGREDRENDRGRRLAFFVMTAGLISGVFRMETEERIVSYEEGVISDAVGKQIGVSGEILEIQENEYGYRLLLGNCFIDIQTGGSNKIRKLFVYVESDPELKLGMEVYAEGELELPEPDRNPGGFDYRLYCLSKGVSGILSGNQTTVTDRGFLAMQERLRRVGLYLEGVLDEVAGEKDAGLLKAILLGNKSDMDEDVYELYRKSGISHVLAISGLHVSVIGMGFWRGLRALGMGYWGSGVLAFAVLYCFGFIAGFGPSVVRAVFMMGISFLAGGMGRTYDLPSAMCVPAIVLLIRYPYLLTQASFQLSFLAVGAIFFPGGMLVKKWNVKGIRQSILMSASIQVMTAPVVLYHSFELPLYGVFLNLLVVPLMTYVLASGILGMAGAFIQRETGTMFLGGAHYILGFYEVLCRHVQGLYGARLILGQPKMWKIIVYYGFLAVGTVLSARKGKRWLLLWLAGMLFLAPVENQGLSVTFLDVGQGDGIFIEQEGKTMLVDCGSSQMQELGKDCLVPFLMSRGINRLDTVTVSHGDQDHVSAVKYLLETPECGIAIGNLVMPETGCVDAVCRGLESLAAERNIPVLYVKSGDSLSGCLGNNVEIHCLYPTDGMSSDDRNDGSLVLRLRYGNFSMILTGDVGAEGERAMLNSEDLMQVTILKAAHHGSASSTCQEFLDIVRPSYVIFSYGNGNRYGHPSVQVVERCRKNGAVILETACQGAIEIQTDGKMMRVGGWLDRRGGI